MIPGTQPKILLDLNENGELSINEDFAKLTQMENTWILVRERDGLTKKSREITWLEWDEGGNYKNQHDEIAIGRSLLMSPFNQFFTWQTTDVTEIIEQVENYIKFKTINSVYTLTKEI